MARKKHQSHENHERWLVSYADFITLLFAFFVVMFASSQTDKSKTQQVQESVRRALELRLDPAARRRLEPRAVRAREQVGLDLGRVRVEFREH